MKHLLPLALLALLAACQPEADPVRTVVAQAKAKASADSTRAARFDSTSQHYHRLGDLAADSATFYHLQSTHVQAQNTAADSATLQRFFSNY